MELACTAHDPEAAVPTPWWLTMAGRSGCGKTHLATEIIAWARKHHRWYTTTQLRDNRGQPCETHPLDQCRSMAFWKVPQLAAAHLNGGYGLLGELEKVFLLVLDDLGAENDPKGLMPGLWSKLLDARQGKWTVITTNLYGDQLAAQLDERIRSRMRRWGNLLLESKAPDYCAAPSQGNLS